MTIIGGDLRIVKLVEMLVKDGFELTTYALDLADSLSHIKEVRQAESLEKALEASKIIVGPIPLSSNKKDINTPFSKQTISIQELMDQMEEKVFIAGSIGDVIYELAEKRNNKIIDLLKREELAVLNTISTAEGAIKIAIEETTTTIHGSNILVMGFGRIGKILANMLTGLGAKVSCEARKNSDLAWIKAYGYEPINLNELDQKLGQFDIIINTIPFLILEEKKLNLVKKDCLLIDLASNPGGIDREIAKQKGIKTIWALSLPGKVAPLTSAEFIKETIYNILKELN